MRTTRIAKSCLFGGALLSAGIACTDAAATPDFLYGPYAQGRVLTDPDGNGILVDQHTA